MSIPAMDMIKPRILLRKNGKEDKRVSNKGRPRTRDPREARLYKKFEPVTWKPIYEQMVYDSCLGKTNVQIAKEYDYTPQQVCNILGCTKAKLSKQMILNTLRDEAQASIGERLGDVADKFMKRLEHIAKDEELFQRAPFAVVDRGLRVLAGLGHIKSPDINHGSGPVIHAHAGSKVAVMSNDSINALTEAIHKSEEARRLHIASVSGVEVHELKTGS